MKKKVSLIVLIMGLLMLFAAVPVMAEPTKGQKVPAELYPGPLFYQAIPEKIWTTNGGIHQIRGGETDYYPIILHIGSDWYTDGYSTSIEDVVFNSKTGVTNVRSKGVWTFAGIGGFAGNGEMKVWFVDSMPYYSIHTLMHGFGTFEGQTLMLSYDGPLIPYGYPWNPWTGYCLKG